MAADMRMHYFAMFYAGLVSMQYHPKNSDNFEFVNLVAFAEIADRMVYIMEDFHKETMKCRG